MPPKRFQEQDTPSTQVSKPAKRPKASRACATCRKTKSRCELLDTVPTINGRLQCHRCKVLDIECSFQNSEIIILSNGTDSATRTVVSTSGSVSSTPHQPQSPSPTPVPSTDQFGVQQEDSPAPSSTEYDPDNEPEYLRKAPWRLLNISDDWTTSPVLVLQELVDLVASTSRKQPPLPQNYPDTTLDSILTSAQVDYLIDIFETRYRPWMNLPPSRNHDVALDLVRCTIASRHLENLTRTQVSPRLQSLVERTLLQPGYASTSSMEFVESLLILALWTPLFGGGYAIPRDNRLLASSAMDIAINLGLSRYDSAQMLKEIKPGSPQPEPEDVRKTRLWWAASNIERMLLIGTGRPSQSSRSHAAHRPDFRHAFKASTPPDTRLGLLRRLFDLADTCIAVEWDTSSETIHRNCKEVEALISQFGWLNRSIIPLAVVCPHEALYSNMLQVIFCVCMMQSVQGLLYQHRFVSDPTMTHKQWIMENIGGLPTVARWGQHYVASTEAALIPFLSPPDVSSLSTAPDNFFLLIAHAAICIITTKASVYQLGYPPISGSGDELIAMTIDRLQRVALSPDHIAAKCAEVVRNVNATWESRRGEPLWKTAGPDRSTSSEPIGTPPLYGATDSHANAHADAFSNADVPLHPGLGPDPFNVAAFGEPVMDHGLLFDPQFWSSFLDNLKQ